MAVDFDTLVNKRTIGIFGEPVTYTIRDGGPTVELEGVFDAAREIVEWQNDVAVSTTGPVLGVRLADFPDGHRPQKRDQVAVRGVTYNVSEPQPDGDGGYELMLKRA